MRWLAVLLGGCAIIGFASCERHSWEETRVLHMGHASHGSGHAEDAHGAGAAEHAPDKAKPEAGSSTKPDEVRFFR